MSVPLSVATVDPLVAAVSATLVVLRVTALGAVASTVIASGDDAALVLPAASVVLTVILCAPPDKVLDVMVQAPVPSAVAVPKTVVPSLS